MLISTTYAIAWTHIWQKKETVTRDKWSRRGSQEGFDHLPGKRPPMRKKIPKMVVKDVHAGHDPLRSDFTKIEISGLFAHIQKTAFLR